MLLRLAKLLQVSIILAIRNKRSRTIKTFYIFNEALPGGFHVARLNFKTSRVGVYKCLSLIVGFAVTVALWPREVVSCRDFILRAVATFWAMSIVGIYSGRASSMPEYILE